MFPVDTIKTRIQTAGINGRPTYANLFSAAVTIAKSEGVSRLYRGISAVACIAIPSHAMYFATYEVVKDFLGGNEKGYQVLATATAGGVATMVHLSLSLSLSLSLILTHLETCVNARKNLVKIMYDHNDRSMMP